MVDDNAAILHVFDRVLTRHGYNVILANSGKTALEKLSAKVPDLIIVDLNLPDINGLELNKLINARHPTTKTIILTGLPPDKKEENLEEVPLILVKPLTAEELIAAIEQTLKT